MRPISDFALLFQNTFGFQRSPHAAGLLLAIWGVLHILGGVALFLVVMAYLIDPLFVLVIPLSLCAIGVVMVIGSVQLCRKH